MATVADIDAVIASDPDVQDAIRRRDAPTVRRLAEAMYRRAGVTTPPTGGPEEGLQSTVGAPVNPELNPGALRASPRLHPLLGLIDKVSPGTGGRIQDVITREALPMAGMLVGGAPSMAGRILSPTVRMAGEAIGAGAGRAANQGLGIEPPSLSTIAASAITPPVVRAGTGLATRALKEGAIHLPGAPYLLHEMGATEARTPLETYKPAITASSMFGQLSDTSASVPMTATDAAINATLKRQASLSKGAQDAPLIAYVQGLQEKLAETPGAVPALTFQNEISTLGEKIRLSGRQGSTGHSTLKQLYATMIQDLDRKIQAEPDLSIGADAQQINALQRTGVTADPTADAIASARAAPARPTVERTLTGQAVPTPPTPRAPYASDTLADPTADAIASARAAPARPTRTNTGEIVEVPNPAARAPTPTTTLDFARIHQDMIAAGWKTDQGTGLWYNPEALVMRDDPLPYADAVKRAMVTNQIYVPNALRTAEQIMAGRKRILGAENMTARNVSPAPTLLREQRIIRSGGASPGSQETTDDILNALKPLTSEPAPPPGTPAFEQWRAQQRRIPRGVASSGDAAFTDEFLKELGTNDLALLKAARQTSRKENALKNLEEWLGVGHAQQVMQGQGDQLKFNAKYVLTNMLTDKNFRGSFPPDEFKAMQDMYERLNKLPAFDPPSNVNYGSARTIGKYTTMGLTGQAIGGPKGAALASLIAWIGPKAVSALVGTTWGRRALTTVIQSNRGIMDHRAAAVLGTLVEGELGNSLQE